jgi:hypothetical protein
MSEPVKFLWDNSDKRVRRIEIPSSADTGLAKVHNEHLKKEEEKQRRKTNGITGKTPLVHRKNVHRDPQGQ